MLFKAYECWNLPINTLVYGIITCRITRVNVIKAVTVAGRGVVRTWHRADVQSCGSALVDPNVQCIPSLIGVDGRPCAVDPKAPACVADCSRYIHEAVC